jgi:hypothetical protein
MRRRFLFLFAILLIPAVAVGQESAKPQAAEPFPSFTHDWRDDPAWNNGAIEIAEYEATRELDGKQVKYLVRITTNKEFADPETKTKSLTNQGREAFKHHVRETIPTANGPRHDSTMAYVGTTDLKSLKLDMSSQDDDGTTFKQFTNHKGTLTWEQFSYLPGEGHKSGTYSPPVEFVFQDALTLVLRGYPFEKPWDPQQSLQTFNLLVDQTSPHLTPADAKGMIRLAFVKRETLDLSVGKVDAFLVRAGNQGMKVQEGSQLKMDYWFAADAKPPWLHTLVQYAGPDGVVYKLKSLKREPR